MRAGITGILASIKAFSESDHTEDLKRIDVPTLILHGDDDQIVPIAASAMVRAPIAFHQGANAQRSASTHDRRSVS
jgi:non-heme chloroperoxidase